MIPQYMEKHKKFILSALAVFLLIIFGVPFMPKGGGPSQATSVAMVYKGKKKILWGELQDMWRRWTRAGFFEDRRDWEQAVRGTMKRLLIARELGIEVSDEEVIKLIKEQHFRRRVQVEYLLADYQKFQSRVKPTEEEIEEFLSKHKGKKEEAVEELRRKKGREEAERALRQALEFINKARFGDELRNAFENAGRKFKLDYKLSGLFDETGEDLKPPLTGVHRLSERVFKDRLGRASEIIEIPEGKLVYRIVYRSNGFDLYGSYHPKREGWKGLAFGVIDELPFADYLEKNIGLTEKDYCQTVREWLTLQKLDRVLMDIAGVVPEALARERYYRDSEQVSVKFIKLNPGEFRDEVSLTKEKLKEFYDRFKDKSPSGGSPGYLVPAKVKFEYVLAEKLKLEEEAKAKPVTDEEIKEYYELNRIDFEDKPLDEVKEEIKKKIIEKRVNKGYLKLYEVLTSAEDNISNGRFPDLRGLAERVGLKYGLVGPVSAQEVAFRAGEVSEGSNLSKDLFDEKYGPKGQLPLSDVFDCKKGKFFFRVIERVPSRVVPFEEVDRTTLRRVESDFRQRKALTLAQEKAEKLRVEILKDALGWLGKKFSVDVITTEPFSKASPLETLKTAPKFLEELFSLKPPALSKPIEDATIWRIGLVLERDLEDRITMQFISFRPQDSTLELDVSEEEARFYYEDHFDSYREMVLYPELSEVREEVLSLLKQTKALAGLRERVRKAHEEIRKGGNPDAIANAYKLIHKEVTLPAREAPPIVDAGGFSEALNSLKKDEWSEILLSRRGRFFFRVLERSDGKTHIELLGALLEPDKEKVTEKELKEFYDEIRPLFEKMDEEKARNYANLPETIKHRIKRDIKEEFRKLELGEKLLRLRNEAVLRALEESVENHPIRTVRKVGGRLTTTNAFRLGGASIPYLGKADELSSAIKGLKVDEITGPTVLKERLSTLIARLNSKEERTYILLEYARFPLVSSAKEKEIPEEEIQKEYERNKDFFYAEESLKISYLLVETAPLISEALKEVTDDEIREYYEKNKQKYKRGKEQIPLEKVKPSIRTLLASRKADEKAKALLEKARKEADEKAFEEIARELSLRNGETEYLTKRTSLAHQVIGSAQLFESARKARAVFGPLRGLKGWFIGRTVDVKPRHLLPLREAREDVTRSLLTRRKAEEFYQKAKSSFDEALKEFRKKRIMVPRFMLGSAVPTLGNVHRLTEAIRKAEAGDVLEPLRTRSAYIVAHLREIQKQTLISIQYFELPAYALRSEEEIAEDVLKSFFTKNMENYKRGETLKVKYLYAQLSKLRNEVKVSEKEAREFYDKNVREKSSLYLDTRRSKPGKHVYLPFDKVKLSITNRLKQQKARALAMEKVNKALKSLEKSGIEAVAEELGLQAGETGYFEASERFLRPFGSSASLVREAFKHKKGELFGPVSLSTGVVVARIIDKRPPGIPPFEEIKDSVENDYRNEQALKHAEELVSELHKKLLTRMNQEEKSSLTAEEFEEFFDEHPVTVERSVKAELGSTGLFSRSSYVVPSVGNAPRFIESAFSLREGELSFPVTEENKYDACYLLVRERFKEPQPPQKEDIERTKRSLSWRVRADFINRWWRWWMEPGQHFQDFKPQPIKQR